MAGEVEEVEVEVGVELEMEVKLDARYRGKSGPGGWGRLVTADEYGMVDVNKAYPGMLKEVTAYAYTVYEAGGACDVELRLGCKNAWKIWLNGKLVVDRAIMENYWDRQRLTPLPPRGGRSTPELHLHKKNNGCAPCAVFLNSKIKGSRRTNGSGMISE